MSVDNFPWGTCPRCAGEEGWMDHKADEWIVCPDCEGAGGGTVQVHPVPAYDPDVLRIFVVHEHPLDFPDAWPVRCVTLTPGRTDHDFVGVLVGVPDSLEEARTLIPPWADTCLPRQADDLPTIRETWL